MFTQLGRAPGPIWTSHQSYSWSSGLPSALHYLLELRAGVSVLSTDADVHLSPSHCYSPDSGSHSPPRNLSKGISPTCTANLSLQAMMGSSQQLGSQDPNRFSVTITCTHLQRRIQDWKYMGDRSSISMGSTGAPQVRSLMIHRSHSPLSQQFCTPPSGRPKAHTPIHSSPSQVQLPYNN